MLIGHASHSRFSRAEVAEATTQVARRQTKVEDPATQEMLERLDDLVYESIGGKSESFDQLIEYWPEVLTHLGDDLVAESREHYLQHALATWTQTNPQGIQDLARTSLALDVLCLLFPEESF
jgi:hypothetical protein